LSVPSHSLRQNCLPDNCSVPLFANFPLGEDDFGHLKMYPKELTVNVTGGD
jgi:hypothetical protein